MYYLYEMIKNIGIWKRKSEIGELHSCLVSKLLYNKIISLRPSKGSIDDDLFFYFPILRSNLTKINLFVMNFYLRILFRYLFINH